MDPLKAAWDSTPTPSRNNADLAAIISKQASPVMRGIRQQLIIELLGYTTFLIVYYDFFDGDKKPLYLNALLVIAVLFLLAYNVAGYTLAKNPATGNSLLENMQRQLQRLKQYAFIAVTSRAVAFICIFSFFLGNIIHWDASKYAAVTIIVLMLLLQQFFLRSIWTRRIKRLSEAIADLKG
jgi:succinate dehydrogenase hydrophobic anchor subunit